MTATIPTREPLELRAGDTWRWRREDLTDYPAPTWVLTYAIKSATASFTVTATADGTAHAVSVAKATTAGYPAGRYTWVAYVDDGTLRVTVGSGELEVLPDFGAAGSYDGRSHARKCLDNIEAYLQDPSNVAAGSYTVAGRQVQHYTLLELIKFREHYKAEVASEEAAQRIAAGLGGRGRVLTRFGR